MSEPTSEILGNPLPAEPLMLASEWLAEAWRRRLQPNPNAMTLATSTLEGWPAARIVLCKDVVGVPGYVVFYTNFQSRKGLELAANPRAAAVMHWDHMRRQVRIEGLVETAPAADSDAYFASRARGSRIGAWASAQSKPVASREELMAAVREATERFGAGEIPRPSFWGVGPAPCSARRTVACAPARGRSPDCSLESARRGAARAGPQRQRRRAPPGHRPQLEFCAR
jgi:pyridoxamine 5'-phosphate oxidase